jgi:3-phytase
MIPRTLLILSALAAVAGAQTPVGPRAETAPVPTSGDAADDPAIWVHPTDPSKSLVIATDKNEGLAVYDLAGQQLQFLSDDEPDNVDLRNDFLLGGQRVTLLAASDRADNEIALYVLDPNTRTVRNVSARSIGTNVEIYGICMYRSSTGNYYAFVTSKSGGLEQWRLFDNGSGKVDGQMVRSFDVGSDCEACVADDETGFLYVAEETEGIWRYGAEPGAGTSRVQVDSTNGHLTADVEGLAIYYAAGGKGYLIASSQGDNTFQVYDRQAPHAHRFNFEVVANGSVDGVTDCDGLEVMNRGMGSAFPQGMLVVQDGSNSGGNQNFKFVAWQDISIASSPDLLIDPTYDPQARTCTTTATTTARNGSNQRRLTAANMPVIGTNWRVNLDCTGHAGTGYGWLVGYDRTASGTTVPGVGEVLVDQTSRRIFHHVARHFGGNVQMSVAIPNNIGLCGGRASFQGACSSGPKLVLVNALDIVMGF